MSQPAEAVKVPDQTDLVRELVSLVSAQLGMGNPLVVATPGVCGGAARIVRTRIPVWMLERMRNLGATEGEILQNFPTLRAADLVAAWSYVDQNREEIEREVRENEAE